MKTQKNKTDGKTSQENKYKVRIYSKDGLLISKSDGSPEVVEIISSGYFYSGDRIEIVEGDDKEDN